MKSCWLKTITIPAISVMLLLSCRNSTDPDKAPHSPDTGCPTYTAEGLEVSCVTLRQATYVIIRVDLRAAIVKMMWKKTDGLPYGSLDEASRPVGGDLLAITNAGIYSENHNPEGLHIEGGQILSPLNLKQGDGNFYWKPNGIFYLAADGAGIIETERFASLNASGGIKEATQSGPMLVINGEINDQLKPESRSMYVRNGIGVKSRDEIYIVISRDEVNLHDFASVFTEQLHCRSALYLDGCVSQLYLPARRSYIPEKRRCEKEFAGLLGIVKRK